MTRTPTLPRDLKPGDKVERLDQDLNFVLVTVEKVTKFTRFGRTAYNVMFEGDPEPTILTPTRRLDVVAPEEYDAAVGKTASGRDRAECSCGWDAPARDSRSEAEADLATHKTHLQPETRDQ